MNYRLHGSAEASAEFDTGDTLECLSRVNVVRRDERAGFIPATHLEKTMTLTYLDYLDNPQKPASIAHQLNEVFRRQQRLYDDEAGVAAVRSIGFVMIDFLSQSTRQLSQLTQIKEAVDECMNPHIYLRELCQENDSFFAPLVRYTDLDRALRTEDTIAIEQGLRTHEIRDNDNPTERNKTIFDTYSRPNMDEVTRQHINAKVDELRVVDLRQLAPAAVTDQEKRVEFWRNRTQEARAHLAARPIIDAALARL